MLRNYLNGLKLFFRFSGSRYIFLFFNIYALYWYNNFHTWVWLCWYDSKKNSANSFYCSFPRKERPIAHEKFVSQKIAHGGEKNEREKGAFVLAIDGFLEGWDAATAYLAVVVATAPDPGPQGWSS